MPSFEQATDYVKETRGLVETMAAAMGTEPADIRVPERGFLGQPLSDEERAQLDSELGPIYAAENVADQDQQALVPVEESGEKMVSMRTLLDEAGLPAYFSDLPFHAACGEWGGKPRVFWNREQVAAKLAHAIRGLNAIGLTLKFQDGFRPVGVQEGLFRRRITDFILPQFPNLSWEQILLEARSKTAISPIISGHKGGASVDATLAVAETGEPLPLGHEYPEGGAMAALEFPYLTREQWRTRQLFAAAMRMAGLVVYPGEDWHASWGDNIANRGEAGYVARYGPIKGFDPTTGAVEPYDAKDLYKPFFSEAELRGIANK